MLFNKGTLGTFRTTLRCPSTDDSSNELTIEPFRDPNEQSWPFWREI